MSYDYMIVDSVLVAYQLFNSEEQNYNVREYMKIGNQRLYKGLFRKFIETIEFLKNKFLGDEGEIICLFDNYHSREELRELLVPLKESASRKKVNPAYKAQRRSAKIEFYNTLDKIKYYIRLCSSRYHTANIPNLEADDLVKPCIDYVRRKKPDCKILLVTNDSDWSRYLGDNVQTLPKLYEEPMFEGDFWNIYGFRPSEESIILHKILYGDSADNVTPVFPEFSDDEKKYIEKHFTSLVDFMYWTGSWDEAQTLDLTVRDMVKKWGTLIHERQTDIKAAYQMLAAIPVDRKHFEAIFCTGRDAQAPKEALDEAIFDHPQTEEGFTFGDIRIPRKEPF